MTATSGFGTSKREGHDSSAYYDNFGVAMGSASQPKATDYAMLPTRLHNKILFGSSAAMQEVPDNSVALTVTSPPYHAGKEYDSGSWPEYLYLLHKVLTESFRVTMSGGRLAINIANLGRKPYVSLTRIVGELAQTAGWLARGEIIWVKAKGASGSCAWGTFCKADNPVLRDLHEYVLVFSKHRFDRPHPRNPERHQDTAEFMRDTLSVWDIPPASAKHIGHPAPFPIELPRRLINLYTYPGDVVLDPFMGSGTTALAARETSRVYLGYENNQDYWNLARERLGADLFQENAS